ncbi:PREDICTED: uncharacterized protein LOC109348703 isoform X1 [Lupinus angustifolius]|uniref:uncharacterized protein LOC109348703 isoform X1 n=1 Tax=Lupinus angustifolius TaxID=3871 RepID=UPI00092E91B2|nr:PREDICTED: uncharacterized protein LOC109348703 isoform X1 [Lupinus angustifolius]XP_019444783.1 PREDICTED: uncharacterized protein LOC109348703 isoform X2 [Lupinus angustifolius]XP_019444784.1 PREDICTED: uncharacterized protein LOC109348703 isoform X1 [Lupinus angustifolius]
MPTFTAIAIDRLLEPRGSKPIDKFVTNSMPVPNSQKLERTTSVPTAKNKIPPRPPLKPALYTTPEVTPLPDSPSSSSFPPSPYIINHKRRGPRLLKSASQPSVLSEKTVLDDGKVSSKSSDDVVAAGDVEVRVTNPESEKEEHMNGVYGGGLSSSNGGGLGNGHMETGNGSITNGLHMENVLSFNLERDKEIEDFFDPQESMSFTSNTDGEENAGTELSMKFSSLGGEFYDAWEELSSESGTQNSRYDVEAELCEMRLSLLTEIEKRKQAEESFNNMRRQWESVRQALYRAGITLPANLIAVADDEKPNSDVVEDLYQQVHVARFISNTIGRGTARAEVEMEMDAQLESKNFEIARLLERLHYYEIMNREMSQRNQEAVETARRERQRIKRRQRWIWGSITTAMALGTAAIAWSYLPMGKGSSCADHDLLPEHDDAPK